MRHHAGDEPHLYGYLMRAMADDWEAGGPVQEICHGWEDAPRGSAIQLRVLAGLFRIVLTGRAPELTPYYPCLGGTAPPQEAWPTVRRVMTAHVRELHDALKIAPQTNEVGRSTALLVGLFEAVRRTGRRNVRLIEPGASAGLNLLVDEFRFVNSGWEFGPSGSPLVLRDGVLGQVKPEQFEVVERRGCDLAPVDVTTGAGRLRLKSFVWPFQVARHKRLAAALEIASHHVVVVDRAPAGEWLEHQLADAGPADGLTVVWQSITRLYWPPDEARRVEATVAGAARRHTVVHVCMEYPEAGVASGAELTVSGTGVDGVVRVARVGDHGTPVTLA